jgi:hypothetical protein
VLFPITIDDYVLKVWNLSRGVIFYERIGA